MGSDPMDTRDAVVLEQHRVLHAVRDAAFAAEHVDDGVAESGKALKSVLYPLMSRAMISVR